VSRSDLGRGARVADRRRWIDHDRPCAGCSRPVRKAEVLAGIEVGWCDLCWQRFVVREVRAGRPPRWYRPQQEAN
jgi:hypothetical protein